MEFIPKNTTIKIWKNEDIDIQKLSEEIRQSLEAIRWENSNNKRGYSGISVDEYPDWQNEGLPGRWRIRIHWTLDGEFGFDIQLDPIMEKKIRNTINKHIPINPLPKSLIVKLRKV